MNPRIPIKPTPKRDRALPRLPTIVERLLACLRIRGAFGLTDAELVEMTALPGDSVRPTRIKLAREGVVVDTGRQRFTRSGYRARVWALADPAAAPPGPLSEDNRPASPAASVLRLKLIQGDGSEADLRETRQPSGRPRLNRDRSPAATDGQLFLWDADS